MTFKRFQVDNMYNYVRPMMLKKVEDAMTKVKNLPSTTKLVDEEISRLEALEDQANNLLEYVEFKKRFAVYIDSIGFYYDEKTDSMKIDGDIEWQAKNRIYNELGVNYLDWEKRRDLENKITAIISGLEETSAEEVLNIVDSQINPKDYFGTNANYSLEEVKSSI